MAGELHEHECLYCEPGPALGYRRLGEGHVGVRISPELRAVGRVFLDDVEVTGETIEALAGEDGWVAVYLRDDDGQRHMAHGPAWVISEPGEEAPKLGHVCTGLRRGRVRVEVPSRSTPP